MSSTCLWQRNHLLRMLKAGSIYITCLAALIHAPDTSTRKTYLLYRIAKCLHLVKYCINSASIGSIETVSNGHVSEVAAIGRCPSREVPL